MQRKRFKVTRVRSSENYEFSRRYNIEHRQKEHEYNIQIVSHIKIPVGEIIKINEESLTSHIIDILLNGEYDDMKWRI